MILNRSIKNKFSVLIAIIFVVLAYIQPASTQFKFCFGDDGHFDVSVEPDWKNDGLHVKTERETVPENHHGECRDLILASNDMVSCRFNSDLFFINHKLCLHYDMPVLFAAVSLPEKYASDSYYSGYLSELCNYYPAFLTSIILLI